MATKTSKAAFGSKENVEAAVAVGTIDAYDIIYMTNGEIGWQNANNETVINTPRTQEEVTVDDITVEAGSTMENIIETLAQAVVDKIAEIETATEIVEF